MITENSNDEHRLYQYFGDVSLCYTNSLAMVLDSYGFNYHPEFLEAIMAMGNGASVVKEDENHPLVFFDNGLPDRSISKCLRILGFEYDEYYMEESNEANHILIKEKLKDLLAFGPVVVGPVDMEYLTYNPNYVNLDGVDHFVSVYNLIDDNIYLHDPAGFAFMEMSLVRKGLSQIMPN